MELTSLTAIGLTPLQAETYALLIEQGEIKPPEAAKRLKTTRSNAYKVLDKLVSMKLAIKIEQGKKVAYAASNPMAIGALTSRFRAEATAREEAANKIMHELLAKYHTHADKPGVTVVTGRKKVAEAYRQQINLREDIYFIRTKADIPAMGFNVMHDIRVTPARHGKQRCAIMTAPDEKGPINYDQHKRSNLEITWADRSDYTAPVEWSVTDSSLLIVLYATEPHAILIVDSIVAGAFIQLWRMLSTLLQDQKTHKMLRPVN